MTLTIKRAKTETLSLRLDPKTKFMLDFLSRVQDQSITTVVERAVREISGRVGLSSDFDSNVKTWNTYWDASEGMRTLNLLLDADYPTNYEEDEILRFTKTHWPLFFTNEKASSPRRAYVDLLWPKIDEYMGIWRDQQRTNYWAAGQAMRADLSAAKVVPPEWPIGVKAPATGPRESFSADLDDEIPF